MARGKGRATVKLNQRSARWREDKAARNTTGLGKFKSQ